MTGGRPHWAVTLFSFTNELLGAGLEPDRLLRDLLRSGATRTVEIDAAQHFRSLPILDPVEVRRTADVLRAEGGAVSVLGGGADVVPAPGAPRSVDAVLAELHAQIDAAALLGADGVRIAFGVLPWDVLRRAARRARDAGVLLLEEVQGGIDPAGPQVRARIADLEASGEPAVRFLLDTSALMTGLPPTYVEALHAAGMAEADTARLADAFAERRVPAVAGPLLADPATDPTLRSLLVTALTRFGSGTAPAWTPVLPWIASVHLKWWDPASAAVDLDGELGDLLDALLAAGFSGALCSEWGGHEWTSIGTSALERTLAHRRLVEARFGTGTIDFGMKTT
jgi:sugar phosphate isomerase/epimerase